MAEKVIRYLTDDMEDSDEVRAQETVCYTVDGKHYELDLGVKNATKFRAQWAVWIAHSREVKAPHNGRKIATSPPKRTTSEQADKRQQDAAIRQWAKANGHPVSQRGAIAADLRNLFNLAHADKIDTTGCGIGGFETSALT